MKINSLKLLFLNHLNLSEIFILFADEVFSVPAVSNFRLHISQKEKIFQNTCGISKFIIQASRHIKTNHYNYILN